MDLVGFYELPGIHSLTWRVYVGLIGIVELPGIHSIVSTVNGSMDTSWICTWGVYVDLVGIGVAQESIAIDVGYPDPDPDHSSLNFLSTSTMFVYVSAKLFNVC